MKVVNFNDFKEKRNLYNETTKFHLKDDIITTDRMFGYPHSGTIVYTNKDTFIYSDSDNEVIKIHKLEANEILFSHFLFDSKTNTLTDLLSLEHKNPKHTDPFVKVFNNEIKNKDVKVVSFKNGKKTITANGTPIVETNFNKLKRINFEKAKSIPANFLRLDEDLEDANLPNVSKISDYSFYDNVNMKILNAPKVKEIGENVLWHNRNMKMCYIPSATYIGPEFLWLNTNKEAVDVISSLEKNWIKMQNKNAIYNNNLAKYNLSKNR